MITILADDKTNELGRAVFDKFKQRGHDVKFFDLKNINIKPCYACYGCEEKTYRRCIVRDDADLLIPYIAQSKVLIAITQITYGSYSFKMKRAIDKGFYLITDKHYGIKNGELVTGLKSRDKCFYAVGVHDNVDEMEIRAFEQLVSETLNIVCWDGKAIVSSFNSFDLDNICEEILL